MAFIKLFPPEGKEPPVADIVRRIQEEFAVVDVDPDEGQDHVAGMIAAVLQFSDSLPHKQTHLAQLQAAQADAVFVTFGDSEDVSASCCVRAGDGLFFGDPEAIDGPARPLLDRLALALGYEVYEG